MRTFNRRDLWSWVRDSGHDLYGSSDMGDLFQQAHLKLRSLIDGPLFIAWFERHQEFHRNAQIELFDTATDAEIDSNEHADKFNLHERERWTAYNCVQAVKEWMRLCGEDVPDITYPADGVYVFADNPYKTDDDYDYDWMF